MVWDVRAPAPQPTARVELAGPVAAWAVQPAAFIVHAASPTGDMASIDLRRPDVPVFSARFSQCSSALNFRLNFKLEITRLSCISMPSRRGLV